ncbi:acyl-CoA dehydrogenase family protein [Mycobacteroides abscessus]|uniref:acyl-CoA dehydrogenase family protein n=1 Tax=Mycobacteroides abscessus TaxID=36809 RepID=UPI000C2563F2|nr:acyl-CoA dehydrogenase [Mycobacteroides abscessus]MDO3127309.1 acyl-CoA dehydrogenase [Mycobacteroides abscessus subsp. bolletii]PVA22728.1 acyl-CoA dehydrogenase [Mycobacteroides abscessus]PVA83800.1 acyl-CoA dehydrogenase [Mycobacteroides abscessus]RIR96061.1 acyl-CoA dehydrogenase [Mycobacteroides abscessus]RIS08040.1 acyl-CoA dehydrogenase [Mycobacteroides abscessus]
MIDFSIPEELAAKAQRVREFVTETVIPYERDPRLTAHGPTEELRDELVGKARAAGLLTVQAPESYGGWGLSHIGQAVIFEAAGWSTLGPIAMNCAAPDEGNMFLLGKITNEEQSEKFLRPVIEGYQRSAFAMTEPDGAGSDPSQLKTSATFDGQNFVINGRKWLITGARGAKTWIIMANLEANDHLPEGPTLFLCDGETEGIVIERIMNTMDRNYAEGHAVVRFDNLTLPREALLGETGQAFRYAQLRLAPARLTHCMRWLGAASRAQDIAVDYARTRTSFGKTIGEHQGVSFMLADNEIALHQCRLTIWHACWMMDNGAKGRHESSMAKSFVSEELFKVTDRCVQVLGGIGISDETPVEMIFRDMRAFRLYDGPTEVHKYAIGRQVLWTPRA